MELDVSKTELTRGQKRWMDPEDRASHTAYLKHRYRTDPAFRARAELNTKRYLARLKERKRALTEADAKKAFCER